MLHIFNRTEIFMTYTKDNLKKVCHAFDKHGIAYTIKTTRIDYAYTEEDVMSEDFDMRICYKVYVTNSDADEAQKLVHEALFPKGVK